MRSSFFFLWSSVLPYIQAFPGGAGACPRGQAAPQGFHPPSSTGEISIEQTGYQLLLNGNQVTPGNEPSVTAGESYELVLSGANIPFRGYLFRGESADGASFSFLSNQGQFADVCVQETEVGITHDENSLKDSVTVLFEPSREGLFLLDLSVVTANNANDGSIYSYSAYAFPIEAVQSIVSPVSPPIPMTIDSSPAATPSAVLPPPPLNFASAGNCRPWPNSFRRTLGQGWRVIDNA